MRGSCWLGVEVGQLHAGLSDQDDHLSYASRGCACRELEQQLEEAKKLAEDNLQRRRQADVQVATLQADLEDAHARRGANAAGGSGGEPDSAFQLRMLQELLQKQEDEVKEARRLKAHVRCAASPARSVIRLLECDLFPYMFLTVFCPANCFLSAWLRRCGQKDGRKEGCAHMCYV